MKPFSSLLLGLTALGLTSAAEAQSPFDTFDGFYAIGYGGLNAYLENDVNEVGLDGFKWDSGLSLGGRVGAKRGQFRVEGELGYRTAEGELELDNSLLIFLPEGSGDAELNVLQASINGFCDISDIALGGLTATPYAGGGLGLANVELKQETQTQDDTALFAMIEAGATLRVTPNFAVVPAYRYEYAAVEIDDEDPVRGHNLQIGGRFDF